MTFVTGFNRETGRFTLESTAYDTGLSNVEEFEDVMALDYKIDRLEMNGHRVVISPAVEVNTEQVLA